MALRNRCTTWLVQVLLLIETFVILLLFWRYVRQDGKLLVRAVSGPANSDRGHILHSEYGTHRAPGLCPFGWTLKTLQNTSFQGRSFSPICMKDDGSNEWVCVEGWVRSPNFPFCHIQGTNSSILPPVPYHIRYAQISEKNKCIFIHIAKTGGVQIERSFLFDDRRRALGGHHIGGHHSIKSFDKEIFRHYFKFGMVRHPCSRLFSVWKYLSKVKFRSNTWAKENMNEETSSNFTAFVEQTLFLGRHVEEEEHLRSQIGMLFDNEGNFGLDQLLVYEKWNDSIDVLSNRMGIDVSSLKMSFAELDGNEDCSTTYENSSWTKLINVFFMDFCVLGYSRNIERLHVLPSLNFTNKSFTERYKKCKNEILRDVPITKSSQMHNVTKTSDFDSNYDPCTVYTYFQDLPGATDKQREEATATLEAWKAAWSSYGWNARIISEDDAKKHPSYQSLLERFAKYPTQGNPEYELACFLRYLAMATVGGGWMSDFDVLPINLPHCTEPCHKGLFTIYERSVPALVSGNASEYTRVATSMADIKWESISDFRYNGKPHVSDMLCLQYLARQGYVITEWLVYEVGRVLEGPFECGKTMSAPLKTSCLQNEIFSPTLPVAIHFSHSGVGRVKKNSDLQQKLWNNVNLHSKMSRAHIMNLIYDFIRKECQIVKN